MVMVPMLVFVFTAKGFPLEHLMHLWLATSMATILFTSPASVGAHHRHGAVDWAVARTTAPGVTAGGAFLCIVYLPAMAFIVATSMPLAPLGGRLAHHLPVKPLRILYAITLLALALRMAWTV